MFHSFTRCDTQKKKIAWETWSRFPVSTPVFAALPSPVHEVIADMMAFIEWYVVLSQGGGLYAAGGSLQALCLLHKEPSTKD